MGLAAPFDVDAKKGKTLELLTSQLRGAPVMVEVGSPGAWRASSQAQTTVLREDWVWGGGGGGKVVRHGGTPNGTCALSGGRHRPWTVPCHISLGPLHDSKRPPPVPVLHSGGGRGWCSGEGRATLAQEGADGGSCSGSAGRTEKLTTGSILRSDQPGACDAMEGAWPVQVGKTSRQQVSCRAMSRAQVIHIPDPLLTPSAAAANTQKTQRPAQRYATTG